MELVFEEMSPAERIRHVQRLWDSIAAHPAEVPVSDEMRAELTRRLADHRASPDEVVSWEDVKAQTRSGK